jgi:hypothetical protein
MIDHSIILILSKQLNIDAKTFSHPFYLVVYKINNAAEYISNLHQCIQFRQNWPVYIL